MVKVEKQFPNLYMMIRCWGMGNVDTDLPIPGKVKNWVDGWVQIHFESAIAEIDQALASASILFEPFGEQTSVSWFKNEKSFVFWLNEVKDSLQNESAKTT